MSPVRFVEDRDAALAREGLRFFDTPLGQRLEKAEMRLLREHLGDCFGARALLLSGGTDERVLDALHVQRRYVARFSPEVVRRCLPVNSAPATIVQPESLPWPNDCFDVVILAHALDFSVVPQQTLREAARVLTEGGRMVITGFNPWSLWGATRRLLSDRPPRGTAFLRAARMADWLSLLDFHVDATAFAHVRPPLRATDRIFGSRFVQSLREHVHLPFGAVWVMTARHRVHRLLVDPLRARGAGELPASVAVRAAGRNVARTRRGASNVHTIGPRSS